MSDPLMTSDETCRFLAIGKSTLYALAAAGKIPYLRVGGQLRFDGQELRAWAKPDRLPEPAAEVRAVGQFPATDLSIGRDRGHNTHLAPAAVSTPAVELRERTGEPR